MKRYILLTICFLLFIGCYETEKDPDAKVLSNVTAFAEAYFNYDFEKAKRMVTPESEKWLRFIASNITQEDIDLVNAQEETASVEAEGYERINDSTFVVTINVRNYLSKDSLEKSGIIADATTFRMIAVKRENDYLVRMEGLPRSERQNHD